MEELEDKIGMHATTMYLEELTFTGILQRSGEDDKPETHIYYLKKGKSMFYVLQPGDSLRFYNQE